MFFFQFGKKDKSLISHKNLENVIAEYVCLIISVLAATGVGLWTLLVVTVFTKAVL